MAIRNNHWYNLNEQRDYPLDDTASALSDVGERLPSALIADLRLRWPSIYGRYAFISAASVTNHIVTFLIEVAHDLDNSSNDSTLIAGVTIPKSDLVPGRTYPLQTFQDHVGGFTTIGTIADELFRGVFSTPRQSLLTARAARASRLPPVPSIGIDKAAVPLTGMINLTVKEPLAISKEVRVINGVEYENVIVLKLVEEAQGLLSGANRESVFSRFAGPCGKRVGSKSCLDPQPIETINGIGPDCDGVLTLDFRGCATVGRNVTDCSVIVDCNLGLSESCDPPYLPELATGKLPSEVPSVLIRPPIPPEPPIDPDVSLSEVVETMLTLPYCDTFEEGIAHGFSEIGQSLFGFIGDDSPGEDFCCSGPPAAEELYGNCDESQSESGSEPSMSIASSYGTVAALAQTRTNISLFVSDVQTLFRTYTTDVKIVQGQAGSSRNAGIVLNYQLSDSGLATYFLVLLDLDTSVFGVYYFNGIGLSQISATTVNDLRTGDWYRLTLTAVPSMPTQTVVLIAASLEGITDPTIDITINTSISANLWKTDAASVGFYARRSNSYFSFWRIDEATA